MADEFTKGDFESINWSDIDLMEAPYVEELIFKYYFFQDELMLQRFLDAPTFKFATKSDLNDAEEFSQRWKRFGSPFSRDMLINHTHARAVAEFSDGKYFLDKMFKERGLLPNRRERRAALKKFRGKSGRDSVSTAIKRVDEYAEGTSTMLHQMSGGVGADFLKKFSDETGVLSLTSNPDNARMWSDYAVNSKGFALAFKARHDFFKKRNSGEVSYILRQVQYRDELNEEYWNNPYYLFLIKDTRYDFEEEWRVVCGLKECTRTRVEERDIYLMDMPNGIIHSAILGENFPRNWEEMFGNKIRAFDPNIRISRAVRDGRSHTPMLD